MEISLLKKKIVEQDSEVNELNREIGKMVGIVTKDKLNIRHLNKEINTLELAQIDRLAQIASLKNKCEEFEKK